MPQVRRSRGILAQSKRLEISVRLNQEDYSLIINWTRKVKHFPGSWSKHHGRNQTSSLRRQTYEEFARLIRTVILFRLR
jgi:hypothetical protein